MQTSAHPDPARAAPPPRDLAREVPLAEIQTQALHEAKRLQALARALLATCTLALAGCGGGDWPDDEHDVPPPGVDCQARPELCT